MKPDMRRLTWTRCCPIFEPHPPEADARLLARIVDDAQALQLSRMSVRAVSPGARTGALTAVDIAALGGSVALAGSGNRGDGGLVDRSCAACLADRMSPTSLSVAFGREAALDYVELFPDFTTLQIEG